MMFFPKKMNDTRREKERKTRTGQLSGIARSILLEQLNAAAGVSVLDENATVLVGFCEALCRSTASVHQDDMEELHPPDLIMILFHLLTLCSDLFTLRPNTVLRNRCDPATGAPNVDDLGVRSPFASLCSARDIRPGLVLDVDLSTILVKTVWTSDSTRTSILPRRAVANGQVVDDSKPTLTLKLHDTQRCSVLQSTNAAILMIRNAFPGALSSILFEFPNLVDSDMLFLHALLMRAKRNEQIHDLDATALVEIEQLLPQLKCSLTRFVVASPLRNNDVYSIGPDASPVCRWRCFILRPGNFNQITQHLKCNLDPSINPLEDPDFYSVCVAKPFAQAMAQELKLVSKQPAQLGTHEVVKKIQSNEWDSACMKGQVVDVSLSNTLFLFDEESDPIYKRARDDWLMTHATTTTLDGEKIEASEPNVDLVRVRQTVHHVCLRYAVLIPLQVGKYTCEGDPMGIELSPSMTILMFSHPQDVEWLRQQYYKAARLNQNSSPSSLLFNGRFLPTEVRQQLRLVVTALPGVFSVVKTLDQDICGICSHQTYNFVSVELHSLVLN